MANVYWVGVAAVTGVYALFLGVGAVASRKVKQGDESDFILAGRKLPLWVAVMTMTATWVDGGYLNGTTEATYAGNLAVAFQPGFCFGLSLILGGWFFAKRMRAYRFTTLIDPFELRYGKQWAAVLFLPAMLAETVWSAALLVAIGSTFNVFLGIPFLLALILSGVVVTVYTFVGGMWSVAYTDAVQLLLIPTGLLLALPFALEAVGGFDAAWRSYAQSHPGGTRLFPPLKSDSHWSPPALTEWWDLGFMLVLGGIPWNCYFQRVLSCPTPERARWHSILSGVLTILLAVPPVLLGIVAAAYFTGDHALKNASDTLPVVMRELAPSWIGLIGLLAIVGAVTSSYSSSILSAGAMFAHNVYRPLIAPEMSMGKMKPILRIAIVLVSMGAAILALTSQSVFELWTFTADLVFVLLFPQLLWAMFDSQSNLVGSAVAFVVSLVLRLGGGVEMFGVPAYLDYPPTLPFRTLAAATGVVLLPVVSRLTASWCTPRELPPLPQESDA